MRPDDNYPHLILHGITRAAYLEAIRDIVGCAALLGYAIDLDRLRGVAIGDDRFDVGIWFTPPPF